MTLEVANLTVRFGGNVAVNDLTFAAPAGRITGLIGPNGAGKSTTFNACSGLIPSSGRVALFGADITRQRAASRARRGLGRTFQQMDLFDSMTVRQNVGLGREARIAGSNPWRQFVAGRQQRRELTAVTDDAIELCGITELASQTVGLLTTGQRRLVELARVCAGGYGILLLDEPSSGLDPVETEQFGSILRSLVAERSVGILLVEHDMELVTSTCEYLYVLDFGTLIFEGTPREIHESEIVRAAYLGSEEGLARSGSV